MKRYFFAIAAAEQRILLFDAMMQVAIVLRIQKIASWIPPFFDLNPKSLNRNERTNERTTSAIQLFSISVLMLCMNFF